MAERMCAHKIVITEEYIVLSCSKMFEDGSMRKVKVLSTSERHQNRPTVIAEQSTPIDKSVMVSPSDDLRLMRHSASEHDVIYSVGSTVITIKLISNDLNVGWRTWINAMNTCVITT